MMYGTQKQIEWATDIVERVNNFSNRISLIRGAIEDAEINSQYRAELIDVTDKIFKRVEYINKENDASALVNWYGYVGLEKIANKRRYEESLEKFIRDMLDIEDIKYISELMKIDKIIK